MDISEAIAKKNAELDEISNRIKETEERLRLSPISFTCYFAVENIYYELTYDKTKKRLFLHHIESGKYKPLIEFDVETRERVSSRLPDFILAMTDKLLGKGDK